MHGAAQLTEHLRSPKHLANARLRRSWQCSVCSIETPGQAQLLQHLEGSKHSAKVATATGTAAQRGPATAIPAVAPRANFPAPAPPAPAAGQGASPAPRPPPVPNTLAAAAASQSSAATQLSVSNKSVFRTKLCPTHKATVSALALPARLEQLCSSSTMPSPSHQHHWARLLPQKDSLLMCSFPCLPRVQGLCDRESSCTFAHGQSELVAPGPQAVAAAERWLASHQQSGSPAPVPPSPPRPLSTVTSAAAPAQAQSAAGSAGSAGGGAGVKLSAKAGASTPEPTQSWGCALCKLSSTSSPTQLAEHCTARRHLQAARQSGLWGCPLCGQRLKGEEEFTKHMRGHRHGTVAAAAPAAASPVVATASRVVPPAPRAPEALAVAAAPPASEARTAEAPPLWGCELCRIGKTMRTPQLLEHLQGQQHQKAEQNAHPSAAGGGVPAVQLARGLPSMDAAPPPAKAEAVPKPAAGPAKPTAAVTAPTIKKPHLFRTQLCTNPLEVRAPGVALLATCNIRRLSISQAQLTQL